MLCALSVRDMLLIDRLEVHFAPGLNVLTGETGAGKSILLDCLGFVLGWRGRADLVRPGADRGEVVAEFQLPERHAARDLLAEAGIDAADGLILRRVNHPDGRKQAWVNDRRASGDLLRRLSDLLVERHGQNDDRGLLDAAGHRMLLDAFADAGSAVAAVRAAWAQRSAAAQALAALEAAQEAAERDRDYLAHAARELADLDPQPGEDAALDARRRALQAAERIGADLARAAAALGRDGAQGMAADALRWLEDAAARIEDGPDEALAATERALAELAEAEAALERFLHGLSYEPQALEAAEERLFAIRAAARKHRVAPDDLPGLAADLAAQLAALEDGGTRIAAARAALAQAEAAHASACARLGAIRREAAARLDQAMTAELAPLKLDRAVFATAVEPAEPGPLGADQVEFRVTTNPGLPPGPLARVASGGELSRLLLALKVCLARDGAAGTLIFDEIDRGVGGATADAVGRRLARLAAGAQVLVVTHSPQVAARGSRHFRVAKVQDRDRTLTQVVALDPDARADELARMLAGERITEEARAAARALLAG